MFHCQLVREDCEHGRAKADEHIRTQASGLVMELPLQSDDSAENRGYHQTRDGGGEHGRHLSPEPLDDLANRFHQHVVANFTIATTSFRLSGLVNPIDYRPARLVRWIVAGGWAASAICERG